MFDILHTLYINLDKSYGLKSSLIRVFQELQLCKYRNTFCVERLNLENNMLIATEYEPTNT